MEITFIQGLLLSIAAMIFGIDFWLESFFIFRPLIVSTITGLILGDVKLGLTTGALTELAFAGLTPCRWNTATKSNSSGCYVYSDCLYNKC